MFAYRPVLDPTQFKGIIMLAVDKRSYRSSRAGERHVGKQSGVTKWLPESELSWEQQASPSRTNKTVDAQPEQEWAGSLMEWLNAQE